MKVPRPAPGGGEPQSMLSPIRTLVYTVAYDERGKNAQALMARMLTASLYRCGYSGDIAVFHNQRHALFEHGRRGLTEIRLSAHDLPRESWRRTPHRLKFTVRQLLDFSSYDWVLFLDADCLALRDPTPLLGGEETILFQTEPAMPIQWQQFNGYLSQREMRSLRMDGVNSGTLAVRGGCFGAVMEEWERIDQTMPVRGDTHHEQGAWNRVILDGRWPTRSFRDGSIIFPYFPLALVRKSDQRRRNLEKEADHPVVQHASPEALAHASIAHLLGPCPHEKRLALMFGLYMTRFFADRSMTLLHLLDV